MKFMAGKSGYWTDTLLNATNRMRDKSDPQAINLPKLIRVICDNAFRGLENVTTIKIGKLVECIGEYGLSNPTVSEVVFSKSYGEPLLTLKDNAFAEMPNLQKLVLPEVKSVGKNVFGPSLTSLQIYGRPGKYDPEAFASATSLTSIIVDRFWVQKYEEIVADCGANIKVEYQLTEKELKAIRREEKIKAKAEAKAKSAAEAEKSKVYAKVRLHILRDCGAEVRWAARGNSSAPIFCSESYLNVVVETIFPKGKTDSVSLKIKNTSTGTILINGPISIGNQMG